MFMNGLRYSPEDQKKVEAKIDAGVSASTQEASAILREIHETTWDLNIPYEKKAARVMAMFATLVVSLSIKADRVQKWMVVLTVLIAVMTAAILGLTWVVASK